MTSIIILVIGRNLLIYFLRKFDCWQNASAERFDLFLCLVLTELMEGQKDIWTGQCLESGWHCRHLHPCCFFYLLLKPTLEFSTDLQITFPFKMFLPCCRFIAIGSGSINHVDTDSWLAQGLILTKTTTHCCYNFAKSYSYTLERIKCHPWQFWWLFLAR